MNNELSWSAAREARIDRAIDRAVREMMQVDPPPGLRRRVLARLNESNNRDRHFLPQLAFAALAMMIVLLATSIWYRGEPPTPPQPPAMATGAPVPIINSEAVMQQQVRGEAAIPGQITKEPIRMPRVTNVFGGRPREASAATVDAGRREIFVAPLTIVPLSARPLVIEPLILPPLSKGGQ